MITGYTPDNVDIRGEVQSAKGYVRRQVWTNPLAAAGDNILDGVADDTTYDTDDFELQPDVPRNLTMVASGTADEEIVVTGTNIRDEVITETFALTDDTPVVGTKCFKTISTIAVPDTANSVTIDVGMGSKLGLDRTIAGAGEGLYGTVDGVKEGTAPTFTASASAIESNGVTFNTALAATKVYVATFVSLERTSKTGATTS